MTPQMVKKHQGEEVWSGEAVSLVDCFTLRPSDCLFDAQIERGVGSREGSALMKFNCAVSTS